MARPRIRFLSVLLISAAASICAWLFIPSSRIDRVFFDLVVRGSANPPFIISGNGTQSQPWSRQLISPYQKADSASAPLVISLGDDKDGIFQSQPPSPVDFAIILKNMRRLGTSKAAISALLAWEKPDTIALTALDSELAAFKSVVTAAPLSRSAGSSPLPPTFRRASIPLDRIRGDTSSLPAVNHVSLPGLILGGDSALSGFSILEREENVKSTPLIARWDDRAVFAFPLIAVLQQRGLSIDSIQIELGNFIKFGNNGPVIPIDDFGRSVAPLRKFTGQKIISAEALIDAKDVLPINAKTIVVLRDDQSASEITTRDYSEKIASVLAAISSGAGMSAAQKFPRIGTTSELIVLGAIAVLLASFTSLNRFSRQLAFGLIAAVVLIAHLISAAAASIWLPTLPALAATFSAFLVSRFFNAEIINRPIAHSVYEVSPEPQSGAEATEITLTETPAIPKQSSKRQASRARKTAAKVESENTADFKNVAAKKTPAARKAAARKAPATKKSRHSKKSPPEKSS